MDVSRRYLIALRSGRAEIDGGHERVETVACGEMMLDEICATQDGSMGIRAMLSQAIGAPAFSAA